MVSCAIITYETHFAVASACNALNNGRPQRSCGESYTAGSVIRRDRMTRPGTLSSIFYPRRFGPHEPSGTTFSEFRVFRFAKTRTARSLYSRKRTLPNAVRMTALGQQQSFPGVALFGSRVVFCDRLGIRYNAGQMVRDLQAHISCPSEGALAGERD